MAIYQDLIQYKRLLRPNLVFYQQLIENVMVTVTNSTIAHSAMLDHCEQYLLQYNIHRTAFHKFAKTYRSVQAARWYTTDCFIHRVINHVLWTGDVEKCFLLRYYISNLSEQLYQLKCQQQGNAIRSETHTVLYRGLRQSEAQLETLRNLIGQTILIKGFMSTSRSSTIALWYAGAFHPQSLHSQPLLIEIYVDMTAPDIIAADITHLSNFPEEQEVLFDIGCQFRVESLMHDSLNTTWLCRLLAMSNKSRVIQLSTHMTSVEDCIDSSTHSRRDEQLDRIMYREKFNSRYNNEDINSSQCQSSSMSWIASSSTDRALILQQKAMIHWQRSLNIRQLHLGYKRAWKLFQRGLNNTSSEDNDTACFLNSLGYACQKLNDTQYAIDLLKRSYEIRDRLRISGHFRAQVLRNLGLAYANQGDYDRGLASLNQALTIGQQERSTTQWSTSITYKNLGRFYHIRGDYLQATEYFSKALETFQRCANFWTEC